MAARRTGGLGKGLDALIPNKSGSVRDSSTKAKPESKKTQFQVFSFCEIDLCTKDIHLVDECHTWYVVCVSLTPYVL